MPQKFINEKVHELTATNSNLPPNTRGCVLVLEKRFNRLACNRPSLCLTKQIWVIEKKPKGIG
jgi:hypothetical protein